MVTVINYKKVEKEDGTFFFLLEVQGGVEIAQSKQTGNFYATAKKSYLSSTFDENTCIALIGSNMPGTIKKVECEPYDYIVKETGEEITLYHRWQYFQEDEKSNQPKYEVNTKEFHSNGVLEYS